MTNGLTVTEETDREAFVRMLVNILDIDAYRIFNSTTHHVYPAVASEIAGQFYDWLTRIGWKIERGII